MSRLHVEVEGRVQGVGYRWFVRQAAVRKGIRGWVKNRPDGCVEVAAVGSSDALERFRSELLSGPAGAHVTAIRDLQEISGEFADSFLVQR